MNEINNDGLTELKVVYRCIGCRSGEKDPCYLTFKSYCKDKIRILTCPFSQSRGEKFELLDFVETKEVKE